MTTKRPRMLVVRPVRETCLAFYTFFKEFDIDYVVLSHKPFKTKVGHIPPNMTVTNLLFKPLLPKVTQKFSDKYSNLTLDQIDNEIEERIKSADVVNIPDTYYFYNYQLVRLAKKYKKHIVSVIWMNIPHHPSTWLPPYSFVTKHVIKNTDLFILRNKLATKFTQALNIPQRKQVVIYKGVNINHFKPNTKYNSNKVKILYVGKLIESKGVMDLVSAFTILSRKYKNIELVLAGEGPLKQPLTKLSNKLPIKLLGSVAYNKLPSVYQDADIFCSPSKFWKVLGIKTWQEYFSYTLIEAQASGLPIVTTSTGGIPEEVASNNLFVPPGKVKSLAHALEKLIQNKKLRIQVGKENRRRAVHLFDAKHQGRLTEKTLLKLLQ